MLDQLYRNLAAPFTRWAVQTGALESLFVIVDVGVRGGVSTRWESLGDALDLYGFDPDQQAIAALSQGTKRKYFTIALGEVDDECTVCVPPNAAETYVCGHYVAGDIRRVPMRRLDTLFIEGTIGRADFIKLDCEGYEPQVLKGAARYLDACNLVGADLETSFNISATLPNTHFWESYEPLLHQRLLLDDIAFDRLPRPSFAERVARTRHGVPPRGVCRPATCNVFLGRNLIAERSEPSAYRYRAPEQSPSADTVIKAAITFEVHGLNDLAFDLVVEFQDVLASRLDVDRAKELIAPKLSRWRAARSCVYTPHMGLVTAARLLLWRR
jgi:FkbM family methyltransferase